MQSLHSYETSLWRAAKIRGTDRPPRDARFVGSLSKLRSVCLRESPRPRDLIWNSVADLYGVCDPNRKMLLKCRDLDWGHLHYGCVAGRFRQITGLSHRRIQLEAIFFIGTFMEKREERI